MTEPKYPWIVVNIKTESYECQRCKGTMKAPKQMMSFDMAKTIMDQFMEEHKDCRPIVNPRTEEMLYWEKGDQYFSDIDEALEHFFNEDEDRIPETLQPCRRVKPSLNENKLDFLKDTVLDYIDENWEDLSTEHEVFSELVSAKDEQQLKRVLGLWLDKASFVVEPDTDAEPTPFKEMAIGYNDAAHEAY